MLTAMQTFGLKNVRLTSTRRTTQHLRLTRLSKKKKKKNKSAKVQKQVAQIQAQAATAGKSPETLAKEKEKELRAKEKADEEKRRKEEAALFKPVQTQKVPFGVDPKTVLCEFFKAGRCEKGSKCKFSHDPDVGRRVEKRNLYEDNREDKLAGVS